MGSNDESMQVPTLEVSAICDVNVKPVEGNISPNYGFRWYSALSIPAMALKWLVLHGICIYIYIYIHTCILYIYTHLEYLSMRSARVSKHMINDP